MRLTLVSGLLLPGDVVGGGLGHGLGGASGGLLTGASVARELIHGDGGRNLSAVELSGVVHHLHLWVIVCVHKECGYA